jgi:hypothetical protein
MSVKYAVMNDTEHVRNPSESAPASGPESRTGDQHDMGLQDSEAPDRNGDDGHSDRSNDSTDQPREIGGRKGPDPVRYGDWEKNGRCIDF